MIRTLDTPDTPLPRIAILGRVPYTTMVSGAGSGMSRFGDIVINRWRNDGTRDDFGQWCYLKDVRTGKTWSAGHQPVCAESLSYLVEMTVGKVTIRRRDGGFETVTEIVVVPETGAECRRVSVSNLSDTDAEVELTSYQEVVLASHVSDRGHRAFGNLFVQTEWLLGDGSILAMRRPRSKKNMPAWGGQTIAVRGAASGIITCETDRARFIGRGRAARNPVVMDNPGELSGTVGAVLDPVLALRTTVSVAAGGLAQVIFTTFVAADRDEATRLAARFHDYSNAEAAFELSDEEAERELGELNVTAAEAAMYQDLAGVLLYGSRAAGSVVADGRGEPGRADLLAMGIAGDHPIVLAALKSADDMSEVSKLLRLHRYWREKGIAADLVILCGDGNGVERMAIDVTALVTATGDSPLRDEEGGVFVRRRDLLSSREIAVLGATARLRMECGVQSLDELANV